MEENILPIEQRCEVCRHFMIHRFFNVTAGNDPYSRCQCFCLLINQRVDPRDTCNHFEESF